MDINLGTAVVGTIAITISALPFVKMSRSRKKRDRKFLQSLSEIASQNNGQLTQHEVFNSFAIGLDETKNRVLFYSEKNDEQIKQIVDLSDIKVCKVVNTSRTFKKNNGNRKEIERLELSFIPKVKNKSEVRMEFFDAEVNAQLYGELQSIEKWSKRINDRLNIKK